MMLRKTAVVLCLFLTLLLSGCPSRNTLRSAVADIAAGLQAGDKSVQTLYTDGAITAREATIVEGAIRQAFTLNDKLNACVDLKTTGYSAVAACVSLIESDLKSKQAEMILGIKDPKAQADFQIAVALFDQGLVLLDAALNDFKQKGVTP